MNGRNGRYEDAITRSQQQKCQPYTRYPLFTPHTVLNFFVELFKALLLIESLTKQLDTDQNFATNTILDLTSTIMDLKSKLKEATESAASIHTEVEHLRKVEAEHRAIINSLQSGM